MGRPSTSTISTLPGGTAAASITLVSAIMPSSSCCAGLDRDACVDGLLETLANLVDADSPCYFMQEAGHDELLRLCPLNAAALQVEDLLLVHGADAGAVRATGDLG